MLTVYSTQGSPGASTTAMHLAAHWASEGREILLIEADPAGGSLSHNLGIQFTPGSASFVASGLPIQSNHLIDHAQDVLFESLHVMPAPASPTGARGIFDTFADFAEELRAISENEMAVIIDGGRITADTAASGLTTAAAGVVVVCRNNSQLSNLEHLTDVLGADAGADAGDGPVGCAVTIGKSPMSPEEWQESGLTLCGSIEVVADMATDLSAYLARGKRKSKKWRASLEQVAESLYPYAQPPVSNRPRRTPPAEEAALSATEPADDAGQASPTAAAPEPSAAQDPAAYEQAPPEQAPPEHFPTYEQAPPEHFPAYEQAPPMAPAPGPGHGQSHYPPPVPESQPGHRPSHYLPPTGWPGDPRSSGTPPGYPEAPPTAPPEGFPAYGQPAPPPYPPAHPYEQPPEAYQQQPGTYEQPPEAYQQQPGTYAQPPEAYQQQPGTYQQHPPGTYEQPQQPAHRYEQPPAQPEPPTQQTPFEQPPEAESSLSPNIKPTGSFRDWALKLHGSNAEDMTARRGG